MKVIDFEILAGELEGDLFSDDLHRLIYATDGSAYRELPVAVTRPACKEDVRKIIKFARENATSVIPRGAGTSLAGQVVGGGIVVDVSKYLNRILEFNPAEKWIIVEPGVVLGELNSFLARYNLMFGPETSTANRCCLGGMLGNNSCGLHSIIYGSVRDHILEVGAILSDGTDATFRELTDEEFLTKCNGDQALLETRIYGFLNDSLSRPGVREEIRNNFPDKEIRRRNHGYAIDSLLETNLFTGNGEKINICKLLAGSEGTLAFTVSMKLDLIDIPSKIQGLVCAHFSSMQEALEANIIALESGPVAIELIDNFIVNCTKDNPLQSANRFFIDGDPGVILIIEFLEDDIQRIRLKAEELRIRLVSAGLGYSYPLFTGSDEIKRIWELRKAGLGVLLNIPGDRRSVQVIEDTAVHPRRYPEYFSEVEKVLGKYGITCSYYGHISTGELHFSPLLDLKNADDIRIYHNLAKDIASLVRRFRGSLSGEHGDGRLRGEFIPFMFGESNYRLLKELKHAFDPGNILNPGKITDTPSITDNLRYPAGRSVNDQATTFSFPGRGGILYSVEKCSGSGDCRKSQAMGGTMCPTFMVSGDEDKSTRGRANVLREFLTFSPRKNPFDHEEIYKVMDLCISCKACKAECPSNVDMATFKAEFLQHYYDSHGVPFRTWIIGWLPRINKTLVSIRPVVNFVTSLRIFKKLIGFTPERDIPPLSGQTLHRWARKNSRENKSSGRPKVYLFADEFTDYNESDIGIKAILLLDKLGYDVSVPAHSESGRTLISKGLLRAAKKVAVRNINALGKIISDETPLIGLEPSAILTFRDEYPAMLEGSARETALRLAKNSIMFEEFICREADSGRIVPGMFTSERRKVLLHGHCQQKAVASVNTTRRALSLPVNYEVEEIASGCCGMAGAFGYEKEHYDMSMKIGEMVLFPAVRAAGTETIIAAPGTSCRRQIADGTGRKPFHPAEILYDALDKNSV